MGIQTFLGQKDIYVSTVATDSNDATSQPKYLREQVTTWILRWTQIVYKGIPQIPSSRGLTGNRGRNEN